MYAAVAILRRGVHAAYKRVAAAKAIDTADLRLAALDVGVVEASLKLLCIQRKQTESKYHVSKYHLMMSRQNIIYGNNFRNARLARARSGKIHFRAARHQKAVLRRCSVVEAVTLRIPARHGVVGAMLHRALLDVSLVFDLDP